MNDLPRLNKNTVSFYIQDLNAETAIQPALFKVKRIGQIISCQFIRYKLSSTNPESTFKGMVYMD